MKQETEYGSCSRRGLVAARTNASLIIMCQLWTPLECAFGLNRHVCGCRLILAKNVDACMKQGFYTVCQSQGVPASLSMAAYFPNRNLNCLRFEPLNDGATDIVGVGVGIVCGAL